MLNHPFYDFFDKFACTYARKSQEKKERSYLESTRLDYGKAGIYSNSKGSNMQEGEAGGSSSTVADNQAAGEKELSPVTQLLFASTDWATTSLGPVDQWDPNLRVAADLCLGSLFSCCLLVGPDLTFMYNDVRIHFSI